jgi:hypothetical protein
VILRVGEGLAITGKEAKYNGDKFRQLTSGGTHCPHAIHQINGSQFRISSHCQLPWPTGLAQISAHAGVSALTRKKRTFNEEGLRKDLFNRNIVRFAPRLGDPGGKLALVRKTI